MMGTKNNPEEFDCYVNAEPYEPMFILLGRDPHAAAAVRKWAYDCEVMIKRGEKPPEDMRMVIEARACADAMEKYALKMRRRSTSPPPAEP